MAPKTAKVMEILEFVKGEDVIFDSIDYFRWWPPEAASFLTQPSLALFSLFSLGPESSVLIKPTLINLPRMSSLKVFFKIILKFVDDSAVAEENVGLVILAESSSCQI